MVRIKIREVAESKGIENPFQLMKVTGLNYSQCYLYWNGEPKQIGVDALNRLCMGLGVTPGQLFEFMPDSKWVEESLDQVKRAKSGKLNSERKSKKK